MSWNDTVCRVLCFLLVEHNFISSIHLYHVYEGGDYLPWRGTKLSTWEDLFSISARLTCTISLSCQPIFWGVLILLLPTLLGYYRILSIKKKIYVENRRNRKHWKNLRDCLIFLSSGYSFSGWDDRGAKRKISYSNS